MDHPGHGPAFSLLGGPLHRLGRRLGLVREETDTVRLGLVLGILPWLILLLLALIDGLGRELFSLPVIGGHVRLLVAIPLFFLCESVVDPRMAAFVDSTLRSRAVAPGSLPALESEIRRIRRWKDSWLPDVLCLAAALLLGRAAEQAGLMGSSTTYDPSRANAAIGIWWWNVCLPLFRFLLLRWYVRLILWTYFLWRVSRLELNLLPNHPDGAAGLGALDNVQRHFMPLIVAFTAMESASLAEEIVAGTMTFKEVYLVVAVLLALIMVLFVGPVAVFAPRLKDARLKGNSAFRALAARYVREFDSKWLGESRPAEPLLGSPDIQSLADLANSASTVRNMRVLPVGPGTLRHFTLAVVLPFLPLLLFEYPITELTATLLKRLTGL
jgi:hypothetical protein